jgi:hypothetical protein
MKRMRLTVPSRSSRSFGMRMACWQTAVAWPRFAKPRPTLNKLFIAIGDSLAAPLRVALNAREFAFGLDLCDLRGPSRTNDLTKGFAKRFNRSSILLTLHFASRNPKIARSSERPSAPLMSPDHAAHHGTRRHSRWTAATSTMLRPSKSTRLFSRLSTIWCACATGWLKADFRPTTICFCTSKLHTMPFTDCD